MRKVKAFLAKSGSERRDAIRFRLMKLLASVSYLPIPFRLTVAPDATANFWWSYMPMSFQPSRSIFEYWGDDADDVRLLWRLLRPGMVVFDVGAFHGLYSLIAAGRTGSRGRVVAFEPSARERRRLRLHLRLNRLSNVVVEPYAVGASAGTSVLYVVQSGLTTMNSLRHPATLDPVEPMAVETVGLDQYCAAHDIAGPDVIKIDVEGGELELFNGARDMLETRRPLVLCEVLDGVTQRWGYRARDIVRCLRESGYEWFECHDGVLRRHVEREDYPDVRNYLAAPREKCGALRPLLR